MAVRILESGGKSIRVGAKVTAVFTLLNFDTEIHSEMWLCYTSFYFTFLGLCFFFANDITCCSYLFYTSEVMLHKKGN